MRIHQSFPRVVAWVLAALPFVGAIATAGEAPERAV